MPLETMTVANQARAAKAFTEWEQNVDQAASSINSLANQVQRVVDLYGVVLNQTDAATAAEYGQEAGAKMAAVIAAQSGNLAAALTGIAGGAGMTLNDLLDSLKAS